MCFEIKRECEEHVEEKIRYGYVKKKNDKNEKIKEEVEKKKCKNRMRSNPWQFGHPYNEINSGPLILCTSLALESLASFQFRIKTSLICQNCLA